MSKNFEKIKRYYDSGLWNAARVRNMVAVRKITTEEYQIIVGEEYWDTSTSDSL